ncbi:hypothetical protein GIB67_037914, partial [Kingdonia uniflora]
MLFTDENEDQIHASAPRDLIPLFSDILTEGDIFHVEKFKVSKINVKPFQVTARYKCSGIQTKVHKT